MGEAVIGSKLIRAVFAKLTSKGYIASVGGKYHARVRLEELTLFDLVEAVHGSSVCLAGCLPVNLKGNISTVRSMPNSGQWKPIHNNCWRNT